MRCVAPGDKRTAAVTYGTGNNDFQDRSIIEAAELHLTMAPDAAVAGAVSERAMPQPCLRDNECSQQQLVRLVGHRDPAVSAAASWDRIRREQAALQGS